MSGEFLIVFSTGGHDFCTIVRICPAAILSVLVQLTPCRHNSSRSDMNFRRGIINTFITSLPNSDKPSKAPYNEDNGVLSFCNAALNSL